MQLVLLSGGSGKRLWPLSNNARSKQFLPLLEKEDSGTCGERACPEHGRTGTMESMVQRVVRQIRESDLTDNITIATNASQLDIITNQLGGQVSVVTEPQRRKTFPAIALAASYLSLEKGCPDDEVIVIMPCDPYTGPTYYETIRQMARCVEQDAADLVLMGIKPTFATGKYGYVTLGQKEDGCYLAERFTEKPDLTVAEQLIAQGALWNGGVFAFRLGYIMNIVRAYVNAPTFQQTRSRYTEFPEIAFDYEVVEKCTSMAVVPFTDEWKDLGTWNTLTDDLHQHVIGNAVMGDNCHNTHVINELQQPLYVDGLQDVIVAASPDGILVCSKEQSKYIKKAVEHLTPRPMYEERRWGTYRVLDDTFYRDGSHSLTKSITLRKDKNISYQIHHHRSEVWTFVEGEGIFVLDGEERRVKAGDTVIIPVEHWHAIKALTELTFIEVQSGNPLIEEDIERTEYNWRK